MTDQKYRAVKSADGEYTIAIAKGETQVLLLRYSERNEETVEGIVGLLNSHPATGLQQRSICCNCNIPGTCKGKDCEQAIRDQRQHELMIEVGNKLEPHFDPKSPVYFPVTTFEGQALRTVMETLRPKLKEG